LFSNSVIFRRVWRTKLTLGKQDSTTTTTTT
jgi:hypothetical protein